MVFTLKNDGDTSLVVHDVSAGCSCQKTTLGRSEVPPGGQTTLALVWQVGARRGPVADPLSLLYSHRTADGHTPTRRLDLVVKAAVAPEVEYPPPRLEFDGGRPGAAVVQLLPGTRREFSVRRVAGTAAAVAAEYAPEAQQVVVRYTPAGDRDYEPGMSVVIETDGSAEPVLRVPVVVRRPDRSPPSGS